MKSTPWPISVLKRIIVGLPLPLAALASSKALAMESKSWPSATMVFQPQASHLAERSPSPATSSTGPSICLPFQSVIAMRLSSLWNTANMPASQIWPSSHGEHAGFPDLALLGFAVTAQAEDEVVVLVQLLAEGEAARGGEALAEGTGGLEDAREALADGRVTLQTGAEGTEGRELRHREVTGAGQDGVVHGRHVAGGEDEHVLSLAVAGPRGRILLHHIEIQGCEDVGR